MVLSALDCDTSGDYPDILAIAGYNLKCLLEQCEARTGSKMAGHFQRPLIPGLSLPLSAAQVPLAPRKLRDTIALPSRANLVLTLSNLSQQQFSCYLVFIFLAVRTL